jgi:hypothetical protein
MHTLITLLFFQFIVFIFYSSINENLANIAQSVDMFMVKYFIRLE